MAHEVVVPRLGWTMEEGVFLEWLKRDGDEVKAGDMLFILEGEKSAQEIESVDSGILRIPPDAPAPGTTVPVGAVLAFLVAAGEAAPWETRRANAIPTSDHALVTEVPKAAASNRVNSSAATPNASRRIISPRARRVAAELGIDVSKLRGTGSTGRVRERDVRAAAARSASTRAPETPSDHIRPLSPVRRLIADRMAAGAHETAPVTLTTKADVSNLVSLREQFKSTANAGVVPSYTDLMIKLAATALAEHPALNARWESNGIIESAAIHIGIAVDTEAGLFVPVMRDVASLGLRAVAEKSRALIELARSRRLKPEESQGGTFTITNLGMYGIDAFTPIINLPQCAILGLGRIVKEPVCVGDQIVPRSTMVLSLTFDHRVVDGAPAARFLDTLRQYTEQPGPCLIG
jgi:pyruvate dehydrogenase E2 component (dihydrolipoamide acetyltransferase)